jgi:hypothetical protein
VAVIGARLKATEVLTATWMLPKDMLVKTTGQNFCGQPIKRVADHENDFTLLLVHFPEHRSKWTNISTKEYLYG